MFVKLDNGITQPLNTTIGCKQGCVFSPLTFNLYINGLPSVYNNDCDPIHMDDSDINCLMWADDCVVMSETETGLQIAIDKTVEHFTSLGLSLNVSKTKVMIFNPQGRGSSKFPQVKFYCNDKIVDKCDTYKYLGLIFNPSDSVIPAIEELLMKANWAYFQ